MGDFLGFTFGDIHSSNLGITRVSGGDRYEEQLHPEIKDRTVEVPGLNGEYYFGSDFGTKTFDIEIAFDHLTEEQFRKLRQTFGTKDIKRLIFDERPYKYYMAKLESPIELSYVSFDEPIRRAFSEGSFTQELPNGVRMVNDGGNRIREKIDPWVYPGGIERIYKGEGKISFISYFPFAKSVFKVLPTNQEESDWVISSGILNSTDYANIDIYNNNSITVYNPGDIETGFRLYLPAAVVQTTTTLTYTDVPNQQIASLSLNAMTMADDDIGILIDTNNNLITGVSVAPNLNLISNQWSYTTSGNLYNKHVDSGYFFKIQPMMRDNTATIQINSGGEGIQIFYDYLYF